MLLLTLPAHLSKMRKVLGNVILLRIALTRPSNSRNIAFTKSSVAVKPLPLIAGIVAIILTILIASVVAFKVIRNAMTKKLVSDEELT